MGSQDTRRSKIRKPEANQDKLATFSREESPAAWQRDRGASLSPDASEYLLPALGEAWLGFLP